MMSSPRKVDIAEAIVSLADRLTTDTLARSVASYLIKECRSPELESIMREVARIRQQRSGTLEITVTAASTLSSAIKKQIKAVLGTQKVQFNEVIDKSVIGGVCIEAPSVYLDLTVRGRIQRLKRKQGVYV